MAKVVVISGHPELENSYTNKVILQWLEQAVDDIDIRRLDTLYPDYAIDVATEQQALRQADVVILQFPFYWYSVPALLKKWIDDVFSFNFAYGPEGDKLKGKDLLLSFTIGGPQQAYAPTGYNHFRIEELIKPLEQTAYLAGMNFQTPVYTHGMVYIPQVYNTQQAVEQRAGEHAHRLLNVLAQLQSATEEKIREFVEHWFAMMDQLPADDADFITQLSPQLSMHMPEGDYSGHAGFSQWYQHIRTVFKANCQHKVGQISINKLAQGFQIDFPVQLIAETTKGEPVELTVTETWQLEFDDLHQLKICSYQVALGDEQ